MTVEFRLRLCRDNDVFTLSRAQARRILRKAREVHRSHGFRIWILNGNHTVSARVIATSPRGARGKLFTIACSNHVEF